jgi:transglutaminase-like putative cysteine protease
MSATLRVTHTTTYQFKHPVEFTAHKLMFRPRSAGDLRMLDLSLDISVESDVHWIQDVFSNAVAIVTPRKTASELRFECCFSVEHYGDVDAAPPLADHAVNYPFAYSDSELNDLEPFKRSYYADPESRLLTWVRRFAPAEGAERPTAEMLEAIAAAINKELNYVVRNKEGTQHPLDTLDSGSGSCRDFALLMMEAARHLGLAARFVSGYLYVASQDPNSVAASTAPASGNSTHAWLEIYLPGAGWRAFDPTNLLFGGSELIRVAYARDPSQALPVTGGFIGLPTDAIGMSVNVAVARE